MRLSDLYTQLKRVKGDLVSIGIALGRADGDPDDSMDVQISGVGLVEVLFDGGEVWIYPASAVKDGEHDLILSVLDDILKVLPMEDSGADDLRLMAQLPLDRESARMVDVQWREIQGVYIGTISEEVWLLVRPIEDYAAESLPE